MSTAVGINMSNLALNLNRDKPTFKDRLNLFRQPDTLLTASSAMKRV